MGCNKENTNYKLTFWNSIYIKFFTSGKKYLKKSVMEALEIVFCEILLKEEKILDLTKTQQKFSCIIS